MDLVNGVPNWIQVNDEDELPLTKDWKYDHLYVLLRDVLFQLHSCGKYTLIYRAEITLRREGPQVRGQESLIIEVECPRDGENLRYAGNLQNLDHLPVKEFTVYELQHVAGGDI